MVYLKEYVVFNEEVSREKPIYEIDDIVTSKRIVPRRKITDINYEESNGRLKVIYTYVDEDIDEQQARIIGEMENDNHDPLAFAFFKKMASHNKVDGWCNFPRQISQFSMIRWRDKVN